MTTKNNTLFSRRDLLALIGKTAGVLKAIEKSLTGLGLTMGDVVKMQVFLVGDPAKDNKMDFAGFMEGYTRFFGATAQPRLPVRPAKQGQRYSPVRRAWGRRCAPTTAGGAPWPPGLCRGRAGRPDGPLQHRLPARDAEEPLQRGAKIQEDRGRPHHAADASATVFETQQSMASMLAGAQLSA